MPDEYGDVDAHAQDEVRYDEHRERIHAAMDENEAEIEEFLAAGLECGHDGWQKGCPKCESEERLAREAMGDAG